MISTKAAVSCKPPQWREQRPTIHSLSGGKSSAYCGCVYLPSERSAVLRPRLTRQSLPTAKAGRLVRAYRARLEKRADIGRLLAWDIDLKS